MATNTEKHFYSLWRTTNCAETMNFIMRTHPLHFTTSSTSFHEFIYFIELTHTAAVAEGDG